MSLPDPLMFTIGLIDQITKPIASIRHQFDGLAQDYQKGTYQMASGAAGITASGIALQNALMPAIEMDRVLGETKSLGVKQDALDELANTSYEFALKYGKSATDFVASSYDIQSAIDGLSSADLSQFTLSSNVLAAATKADAGTITNYMGTMYGIFKNQANEIGKSEWIQQVTGQTATAVQMFKTTGAEMSAAFTSVGANATSAGIAMHEQMAIMGTLQSTMSGSEAGTKYKSFLAGVGKAQDALNLSFTDSQGAMLPMVDVLNQIKGKFGDTLDVAEGDTLAKAFGSQEAVATIKLLMADVDGLSNSINSLGDVTGMQKAEEMAAAMTDQSERLSASWYVIRAAFGAAILPAFNDFVGLIADMGKEVLEFTQLYPNLTKYIGYAGVAVLGLVAAGGAFTLMMGASKMAMVAWNATSLAFTAVNAALTSGLAALRGVMLAVNIAMYANPVGLIVAGVLALGGAVVAAVYYFDDLKAMLADTAWGQPIIDAGNAIASMFSSIGTMIMAVFSAVVPLLKTVWSVIQPIVSLLFDASLFIMSHFGKALMFGISLVAYLFQGVANVIGFIADVITSLANGLTASFETFTSFIDDMWAGIKATFTESLNWIIEKLNYLPGVEIDLIASMDESQLPKNAEIPEVLSKYNQQALPEMFQQPAANDAIAPMMLPAQQQELQAVQQVSNVVSLPMVEQTQAMAKPELQAISAPLKPIKNEQLLQLISPVRSPKPSRAASENLTTGLAQSKQITFGDVIINNPPKDFSLAEIAEQQELMAG